MWLTMRHVTCSSSTLRTEPPNGGRLAALPLAGRRGQHQGVSSASNSSKTPVEKAVDYFVFAPIGLASLARQMLPGLIEQGRQRVNNQLNTAKVVGQFAVQQGQAEVNRVANQVRSQKGPTAEAPSTQPAAPASTPPSGPAPGEPGPGVAPPEPTGPPPPVGDLAIPGYDSLSASQVVPRLSGLEPGELDAVRIYEAGGRSRKTILNKIAQLQAKP